MIKIGKISIGMALVLICITMFNGCGESSKKFDIRLSLIWHRQYPCKVSDTHIFQRPEMKLPQSNLSIVDAGESLLIEYLRSPCEMGDRIEGFRMNLDIQSGVDLPLPSFELNQTPCTISSNDSFLGVGSDKYVYTSKLNKLIHPSGKFYCWELATGRIMWSVEEKNVINKYGYMSCYKIDNQLVKVNTTDSGNLHIAILDVNTGETKWSNNIKCASSLFRVIGDYLIVLDTSNNHIYTLDVRNSQIRKYQCEKIRGVPDYSLHIFNNNLMIVWNDSITFFNPANGSVIENSVDFATNTRVHSIYGNAIVVKNDSVKMTDNIFSLNSYIVGDECKIHLEKSITCNYNWFANGVDSDGFASNQHYFYTKDKNLITFKDPISDKTLVSIEISKIGDNPEIVCIGKNMNLITIASDRGIFCFGKP